MLATSPPVRPQRRRQRANQARQRERAQAAWHSRIAKVEAEFSKEARDPSWSSSMLSALKDAARSHEAVDKALQKIDCRSKTCRLEVKEDGSGSFAEQLPLFLLQVGPQLPTMQSGQVDDGNGQKMTVLYLAVRGSSGS